jgi:molybdenum cofactor cytidylyltransferase
MGEPKMLLPWGTRTVIGQVISTFEAAGVNEIVIVTGGAHNAVQEEAARSKQRLPLVCTHNPHFESGEMLSSLQKGLEELGEHTEAAIIALGDQPQLSLNAAQKVISTYRSGTSRLIVPSYNMRRGHPWLVERSLWPELLALKQPQTLRDFLNACAGIILYVEADQTILKDLDTPEQYRHDKP